MTTTAHLSQQFSIDEFIKAVCLVLTENRSKVLPEGGASDKALNAPIEENEGLPFEECRAMSEVQAAAYAGLSESNLRKQRMNGDRDGHAPVIPYVQIGRRIVYLRDDLDVYLEQNRIIPSEASAVVRRRKTGGRHD